MEKNDSSIEDIRENYPDFLKLFNRVFYASVIQYGIIKGNNKILFIKPGKNGSLIGYNEKYYKLAKYINKKYGFTVICSNNPYVSPYNPLDDAMEVINEYVTEMKFNTFEIYYFGNSCGGLLGARYAHLYPNIKKALLINPPLSMSYHKTKNSIEKFEGENMVFIYGSLDPSFQYVGLLDFVKNPKISYKILDGEDHNLSNNTTTYEELLDNYLFNDIS